MTRWITQNKQCENNLIIQKERGARKESIMNDKNEKLVKHEIWPIEVRVREDTAA